MKVTWGVSVFCRYERGILLGKSRLLDRWEGLSSKIQKDETPLAAANRVVLQHTKQQPIFPAIHQVVGAPSGLLLYTEYGVGPDELRLAFIFLAQVRTDELPQDSKQYESFQWINTLKGIPRGSMPYVESTLPLTFMAINLDGVSGR